MSESEEPGFCLSNRLALSISEAAQSIGVSETHLRNIISEIPHLYLGKRVVIPVDLLREWLRNRIDREQGQVDKIVESTLREVARG